MYPYIYVLHCRKADAGLKKVSEREGVTGVTIVSNKHLMAYGNYSSQSPMYIVVLNIWKELIGKNLEAINFSESVI